MVTYEIKQKMIPSAFPRISIMSEVTRNAVRRSPETIHVRRDISDWRTFTDKCVKPLLCYLVGLFETIASNTWENTKFSEKYLDKNLYAIIHDEKVNDKQVFIIEFILCDNSDEANKIRSEFAVKNKINIEKYYLFSYGCGVNENIEDLLYNRTKFIVEVEQYKYNSISQDKIPDYNKYICAVQAVASKKDGEKKNEDS